MVIHRSLWSATTTGKSFLAPVSKGYLLNGFLHIPAAYVELFPEGPGLLSIDCVLQGHPGPEQLSYSAEHTRIAGGMTNWYRDIHAKPGDKVRVEVLVPFKKYGLAIASARQEQNRALEVFESLGLHSNIAQASHSLFSSGHYSKAVQDGYVAMAEFVKQRCGRNINLDGTSLMEAAFAIKKPILSINRGRTESEKDERTGMHGIARGAMLAIRNPLSHERIQISDPYLAIEYLSLASLICKIAAAAKRTRRQLRQSRSETQQPAPS